MEENANTSIDSKIIFLLETIHNNDFLGRLIFSLLTKGLKADNEKKTSHVWLVKLGSNQEVKRRRKNKAKKMPDYQFHT